MSYDTLDITNVTTTINYCQGYSVNTPTGDSGFELQPPHYHQCHYQDPYFQDYRVNTPDRDSRFFKLRVPDYHQCPQQDPYFQDYCVNTPTGDSVFKL